MRSVPTPAGRVGPPARYGGVAMLLHWVLAVAIAGSLSVGLYMADLPISPLRLKLFNWHKWAGVTILVLSVMRLLWRLTHRPPELPPMAAWQRRAALAVHVLMYVLFLAVPLAGWAYSSATGFPVVWFGRIRLPDFVPVDRALADTLEDLHAALAYTLAALVALHVGAALKHHFIDRDGLLGRMWPGRSA